MSPERNELCPCGSGIKFKKCCANGRTGLDPITYNKNVAYLGQIGRRRQQFCLDYTAFKKQALGDGNILLQEMAAAEGESISCIKGCSKCCMLYVLATLQEAECITYYLYQHEDKLKHFITAYPAWLRGLGLFTHKFQRVDQMIAKKLAGCLSAEEEERLTSDLTDYTGRKNYCPFLVDNICSIYEVRPFVCASLVAVTPTETCTWDVSGINQGKYHKIVFQLDQDKPYFVKSRKPIIIGCVPEMVNRLLEGGYSFLAGIEGLESLRH